MSIVWIAAFSFLMNWWASVIGETIGIPEDVSRILSVYVKNWNQFLNLLTVALKNIISRIQLCTVLDANRKTINKNLHKTCLFTANYYLRIYYGHFKFALYAEGEISLYID